jgi:hypothetical protein
LSTLERNLFKPGHASIQAQPWQYSCPIMAVFKHSHGSIQAQSCRYSSAVMAVFSPSLVSLQAQSRPARRSNKRTCCKQSPCVTLCAAEHSRKTNQHSYEQISCSCKQHTLSYRTASSEQRAPECIPTQESVCSSAHEGQM